MDCSLSAGDFDFEAGGKKLTVESGELTVGEEAGTSVIFPFTGIASGTPCQMASLNKRVDNEESGLQVATGEYAPVFMWLDETSERHFGGDFELWNSCLSMSLSGC